MLENGHRKPKAGSLNVVRCGERGRPLVVLVHAIGLDLTYWSGQIAALSDAFDLVAYDLAGHGFSGLAEDDYGFANLSADLTKVIRRANSGPAHVVGLSLGGMIAQYTACIAPELVRSLILIDTAATFSDAARTAIRQRGDLVKRDGMQAIVAQTLERWFTAHFASRRPDVLDRVTKTLSAADAEVHAELWNTIATLDIASQLPRLDCPTLIIVGEQDPTTPPAAATIIARSIANARLEILPETSHMAPIERPGEVSRAIRDFLRGLK